MSGVIGKSGKFYPCGIAEHTLTIQRNIDDRPFAIIRCSFGDCNVEFYEFYTVDKTLPTQEQYEALQKWCAENGQSFDYVTDCWFQPWEKWRSK